MAADHDEIGQQASDADLWLLVGRVREARRLVVEADDLLYGIFGFLADSPDRSHRITRAQHLMTLVADLSGSRDAADELTALWDGPDYWEEGR